MNTKDVTKASKIPGRLAGPMRGVVMALLLALSARVAHAQVLYGTIVGTVTDPSGAVLQGATIDVLNAGTGEVRRVTSNAEGNFSAPNLPAGAFKVTVKKTGFTTFDADHVAVVFNTEARIDAKLSVGAETQVVTITSDDAALLQTDEADSHTNVSSQELEDLPQATRTYEGLVGLAPGVNPPSPGFAGGGGTNNPGRSFIIEANGTSNSATDVRIDGVSAVNPWVQFYSTAVPSTEAIEAVNVVTSDPNAEQGLADGATINLQIKSGGNAFHGEVYEFHQDNALKSKPYFSPPGFRNPKFIDNDFGGTLGGPILRNKLFFFVSYEGDFNLQGNFNIVNVPSGTSGPNGGLTGERAGDFSALLGTTGQKIYNPSTGQPYPNNKITNLSPITQQLVALIPNPNFGVAGSDANNYYVVTPNQYTLHKLDTKTSWDATSKLRIAARYSQYPYNGTQSSIFGDQLGGGNFHSQYGDTYAATLSATYIARSNLLFDASAGFTQSHQFLVPPEANIRAGSNLGIPGVNLGDLPSAGGLPQFNVSGYSGYGYSYPYLEYNDPVFQYAANVTYTRGTHNLKAGGIIAQQHMNHLENNPTNFSFTGGDTAGFSAANPNPTINNYNAFADFIIGNDESRGNSEDIGTVTLHTLQYNAYARDQWQISRKLTLTYGTGYEYYPVPNRGGGRGIERFDFATNTYLICGVGGTPENCGIHVEKNLFTPRIGVAYRLTDKSVFRAGYSLTREQLNMYRDGLYSFPVRLGYSDSTTNPYVADANVSAGVPLPVAAPSGVGSIPIAQLPAGVTFTTDPQNFVRGYVESYNATTERDFGHGLLATLSYVGTHTVHQHTRYDANAGMKLGANSQGQYFYTLPTSPTTTLGITSPEQEILPLESMHYNSLQATLDKTLSHGFQLHAAYTWSKWISICCDSSGDGGPNVMAAQYFNLNRAAAPGDLRHNFVLSSTYQLPFGAGQMFLTKGIASAVFGGFQINGLIALHSGQPFSVTANASSLGAPDNVQRADLIAPVKITGAHDGVNPYFNRSSFADPAASISLTGIPRFGTSSFDNIYGPRYADVDFSLFRTFAVYERIKLQLRVDTLNLFNHPNFANPSDTNVSDSSYGVITTTNPGSRLTAERYFRLGAKILF